MDSIVITGGIANEELIVLWIKEKVEFLAPIRVCPREDEAQALYEGVDRVLDGAESFRTYESLN